MTTSRTFRLASAAWLCLAVLPAHAVNKDMIQLQTQVQQLQDAVARLQQSNDERMGVLKDLVQQTSDSVNKMSITVNGLQLRMQNQQDAAGTKSDQLSGQIQSLNDSLDELKARMGKMERALTDIQSQQQTANAILNALPQGTGAAPAAGGPAANPSQGGNPPPLSSTPATPIRPLSTPAPSAGPSAGEMYRLAYGDYVTGKYLPATSEFTSLIQAYPDDNLAGNAYFYLGEIDTRGLKPSAAVKAYDQVLERYPDNNKVPAAHLHKAEALLSMKQTEAGTRELRALVQRFPNSPEAAQAKVRLAALARQ